MTNADEEREIVYWSCEEDKELLSCEDIDEAVEDFLESLSVDEMKGLEEVEVFGFAREIIPLGALNAIRQVLEYLDEEFGNPSEITKATQRMLEAEREFLKVVIEEFSVWSCEVVKSVMVNVPEWVQKNNPDWLCHL